MRLPFKISTNRIGVVCVEPQRSKAPVPLVGDTVNSTSGLTHVASIRAAVLSSRSLLILCTDGTKKRVGATFISRTWREKIYIFPVQSPGLVSLFWTKFRVVDGSHVDGRFKS